MTTPTLAPVSSPPLRGHALALATLEAIRANPEEFDPAVWRDTYSKCFAGWACDLAGGRWLVVPDEDGELYLPNGGWTDDEEALGYLLADEIDPPDLVTEREGHRVVHIMDRAPLVLGLDPSSVHLSSGTRLFHRDNTPDTLARLIEAAYDGGSDA
ncbi:hypothetical protein [Bailinhaonella thermotolerans]|uniref:Uncharacterized protein n=1 Tax=Bailinhaonella thermotolerans TaxID=1070861 RepID=A0A3A4AJJ2_9ACTN|nr:hypothetical protein [Bailinhaonella thermotolerans]RJL21041.1 hypothetical protein D5H75_38150 [Bailinhaonella thermotolerans]